MSSNTECPRPFANPPACDRTFADELGTAWDAYQGVLAALAALLLTISLVQMFRLLFYRYMSHTPDHPYWTNLVGKISAKQLEEEAKSEEETERFFADAGDLQPRMNRALTGRSMSRSSDDSGPADNEPGRFSRVGTAGTAGLSRATTAATGVSTVVASAPRSAKSRSEKCKAMWEIDIQMLVILCVLCSSITYAVVSVDPFAFRRILKRHVIEEFRTFNGVFAITIFIAIVFALIGSVSSLSTAHSRHRKRLKWIKWTNYVLNAGVLSISVQFDEEIGEDYAYNYGARLLFSGVQVFILSTFSAVYCYLLYRRAKIGARLKGSTQLENRMKRLLRLMAALVLLTYISCPVLCFRGVELVQEDTPKAFREPDMSWLSILRTSLIDWGLYFGLLILLLYFSSNIKGGRYEEVLQYKLATKAQERMQRIVVITDGASKVRPAEEEQLIPMSSSQSFPVGSTLELPQAAAGTSHSPSTSPSVSAQDLAHPPLSSLGNSGANESRSETSWIRAGANPYGGDEEVSHSRSALPVAPTGRESISSPPAPVPPGWEEWTTPEGVPYYYHHRTRTSSWEIPAETLRAAGVEDSSSSRPDETRQV